MHTKSSQKAGITLITVQKHKLTEVANLHLDPKQKKNTHKFGYKQLKEFFCKTSQLYFTTKP